VDVLRELSRAFALEDPFGLWVFEAPNHSIIVMRRVNNVKRYGSFFALTVRVQRPGTRRQQRLAAEGWIPASPSATRWWWCVGTAAGRQQPGTGEGPLKRGVRHAR
jgi:hypothetical protein